MAKSGMYLNGRELLVCELKHLDKADRAQMTADTNMHIITSARRAVLDKYEGETRRRDPCEDKHTNDSLDE